MNDTPNVRPGPRTTAANQTAMLHRIPLVLTAVVVLVNFAFIDTNSFFVDELYSVIASSESSVFRLLNMWVFPDVHPPLYQLVLMGWIRAFGTDETVTRALSTLYYFLSIVAVYALSRNSLSKPMAAYVALLISLAPLALFYSHETRSYAQMMFLATCGFYLWVLWRSDSSRKSILLLCFTALILLSYTHLFGLIFAGGILAFEFVHRVRHREFGLVLAVALTGLICLSAVAPNILLGGVVDHSGGAFWIRGGAVHNLKQLYSAFPLSIQTVRAGFLELALWSVLLGVGFLCAARVLYERRTITALFRTNEKTILGLALWVLAFTILASLVISLHTPIVTKRNLVVVLPPLCLMIALISGAFARALPARTAAVLLAALLAAEGVSAWTWLAERRLPREDFRGAAAYIVENCDESTRIGFVSRAKVDELTPINRMKLELINNYYINKISSENGSNCNQAEFISAENLWQRIDDFDHVQIAHLPGLYMKDLIAEMARASYDVVTFPTSTDYPSLVISPRRKTGGASQN